MYRVFCACALALGACAAAPRVSQIEVVDAADLAAGPDADAAAVLRVGGLSGAVMTSSGELLALTDDHRGCRVITFRLHENPFRPEPIGMISLENAPTDIDPEGIAILPDGRLLVSAEGIQNQEPRVPPGIREYSPDGKWLRTFPGRGRFVPPTTGRMTFGVRSNAGFESLTLAPDGNRLYTGVESALIQDGEPADFQHGARVRLLEYVRKGEEFVPGREWSYDTEPIDRVDFEPGLSVQGLVELIALADGDLLAMERSFVEERDKGPRSLNQIRVFRVSLKSATDISALDSIAGNAAIRPASKQLLVDLKNAPGLPEKLHELENFEAMTFFTSPADGSRSLLLVSDDNFSAEQRTWFLRLRSRSGTW